MSIEEIISQIVVKEIVHRGQRTFNQMKALEARIEDLEANKPTIKPFSEFSYPARHGQSWTTPEKNRLRINFISFIRQEAAQSRRKESAILAKLSPLIMEGLPECD